MVEPTSLSERLARKARRWVGRETPEERLERMGVAIFRGFFDAELIAKIAARFAHNLERLAEVFPDYLTNPSQNIFSCAVPFCDIDEPTLPQRMASITKRGVIDENMSEAEKDRFTQEIGNRLLDHFSFLSPSGVCLNEYSIARFELARDGSPYDFFALHQDAVPALTLDPRGWTAWIALTRCGQDAPSLQFLDQKFSALLPQHKEHLFIPPDRIEKLQLTRPVLEPGDMVVFSAYTLHGTWITPEMTKPRYSLDVRLSPR